MMFLLCLQPLLASKPSGSVNGTLYLTLTRAARPHLGFPPFLSRPSAHTESPRWIAAYVETISLVLGSQWGVLSQLRADPSHAISHPEKISCDASKAAILCLTPSGSLHHLSQEKRWSSVLHCLNFAASIRPKVVAPRMPAQRRIWDQPRCCGGRVGVSSPTAVFFFHWVDHDPNSTEADSRQNSVTVTQKNNRVGRRTSSREVSWSSHLARRGRGGSL